MTTLTAIPGGQLSPAAAATWFAMIAAGMPSLPPESSYRSTASQRAIFLDRYQRVKIAYEPGKYDRRVYEGVAYWRKPGRAAAAIPGTSKHEHGLAVDATPEQIAWLNQHGAAFGWFATIPAEPWHFEFIGAPAPPPLTPHEEDDDMRYYKTAGSNDIYELGPSGTWIRLTLTQWEALNKPAPEVVSIPELQALDALAKARRASLAK